jgi:trehalose 6-phosphate synthase
MVLGIGDQQLPRDLANGFLLGNADRLVGSGHGEHAVEQRPLLAAMRTMVAEFNVYRWAGRMLLDATRLRQSDRLSTRLSHAWRGRSSAQG